nr:hypothetical protein 98 [bacterium]
MGVVTDSVDKTSDATEKLEKSISNLNQALKDINKSVLEGGNTMNALAESIDKVAESAGKIGGAFKDVIGAASGGGLDDIGKVFGNLGSIIEDVGSIVGSFVGAVDEAAGVMDGLTGINRQLAEELFKVSAGFGGNLEAARLYKNAVLDVADTLASYEFGFIRIAETREMFNAARQAKVSLEDLSETINASGTVMEGYAAGILQASVLGIQLSEYMALLGDAIYGQGLDTKEAMIQLSTFRDVADDTGIALDDVTATLQGISKSFRTLGIQADFGEPILRGFAKSLDDIGLGAENAKSLTEDLAKSIGALATNPALAYVTAQFGDLNYGKGGTALGASIDLQARLLEAERAGDQAAVGTELATAMRDTLAQFGGGRIVTVTEASRDARLETVFYTQQRLLEGLFGVSADSSARTLEMLAQLEDATKSGDKDLANQLAKDLAEGKNIRNTTRSWQDAIAAKVDSAVAELALQTDSLMVVGHHLGLMKFDEIAPDIANRLQETFPGVLKDLETAGAKAEPAAEALISGGALTSVELGRMLENAFSGPDFQTALATAFADASKKGAGAGGISGTVKADVSTLAPLLEALGGKVDGVTSAVGDLARAIQSKGWIPGTTSKP